MNRTIATLLIGVALAVVSLGVHATHADARACYGSPCIPTPMIFKHPPSWPTPPPAPKLPKPSILSFPGLCSGPGRTVCGPPRTMMLAMSMPAILLVLHMIRR